MASNNTPRTRNRRIVATCLATFLAGAGLPAWAQSYTTLYEFTGGADGALPSTPLTFDSSGNAYGGTAGGGDFCVTGFTNYGCGTVYKLDPSGTLTTLVTFNATNGALASTSLLLVGDTLYGGAQQGGTNYAGLLFSVKTDGSNFTILHQFADRDGIAPTGQLIPRPGGGFYGITQQGGYDVLKNSRKNYGVLYLFTPGLRLIPLHYFNGDDGKWPNDIVMDGGVIYGSTFEGGKCGECGTVFSYTIATGTFKTLQFFDRHSGWLPMLGAVDNHGVLYGSTQQYGPHTDDVGTLFTLTPSSTGYAFATIANFDKKNGANPGASPLLTPSGALIGPALSNVFGINPSLYLYDPLMVGHILPLAQFPQISAVNLGSLLNVALTLGPSNLIYGASGLGGSKTCALLSLGQSCGFLYTYARPGKSP